MAIDFYKLGRQSGATTPKGQQSGFESLVSSATKPLEDMIKASKATTAALSAAMPAGVPIDKVPEQLRGKVSAYLADNKKEYTDAAKIVASGINPNSQRYRDAVETMNRVSTKFENLSNTLEDIAVKRKAALDDPSFSPATSKLDQLTFENLKNGSIYDSMNLNEDGTFSYQDGQGGTKQWKDFAITKQGFTGQQTFLGLVENVKEQAKQEGATFENLRKGYQVTINSLFDKLGPKGALDYALADDEFLNSDVRFKDKDKDELIKNPNEVIQAYKKYNMTQLEKEFTNAPKYKKDINFTAKGYENQAKKAQEKKKFQKQFPEGPETMVEGRSRAFVRYLNNINQNTRDFALSADRGGKDGPDVLKDANGKIMPPGIYIKKRVANTDGTESFIWEPITNPSNPFFLTWDMAEDYLNYDLIGLD